MKPWDPPEEKLYPVLDDLLYEWMARFSGLAQDRLAFCEGLGGSDSPIPEIMLHCH